MADTVRSLADLQTLLANNTGRDISPQDLRDFLVSSFDYDAGSQTAGGRLTLVSGSAVADSAGSATVYYTPYIHGVIPLYNTSASVWESLKFAETSLALGTVTSGLPYDVFAYNNSGTLALEKLAWTNDTTRATAVTSQNGRLCKSGDASRLYLGTFYTISTTQTADTSAQRFVFNHYNRKGRFAEFKEGNTTSIDNADGYGLWNDDATAIIEVMSGQDDVEFKITCSMYFKDTDITTTRVCQFGFNFDSSTSFDSQCRATAGRAPVADVYVSNATTSFGVIPSTSKTDITAVTRSIGANPDGNQLFSYPGMSGMVVM